MGSPKVLMGIGRTELTSAEVEPSGNWLEVKEGSMRKREENLEWFQAFSSGWLAVRYCGKQN